MTSSNCKEIEGFIKYLLKTAWTWRGKLQAMFYGLLELTVILVCAKLLQSYLTLQPYGQAARQAPLSVGFPR